MPFSRTAFPETQRIVAISADLTSQSESAKAYNDAITRQNGLEPETVFLCAGHAKPGFFVEADERDLRSVSRLGALQDVTHLGSIGARRDVLGVCLDCTGRSFVHSSGEMLNLIQR
jgi:hypothetical protein